MCFLELLFLLIDIVGNIYTLSTHQSFIISMDYVPFIVLFNAGMLLFIFLVDYGFRRLQRYFISEEIGEGILDLYHHEH
ncbi:MAG: hypothetical protein ACXWPG_13145 [Ktedonobacteraceae bacterium]